MKNFAKHSYLSILVALVFFVSLYNLPPKNVQAANLCVPIQGNTAANISNLSPTTTDGTYIYFHNPADGYKTYRMNLDGSNKKKITDVKGSLYVAGNWLYIGDFLSGIYKMKKDGSGSTIQLTKNMPISMCIYGDYIYYTVTNGVADIWKMKIDGSQNTKLKSSTVPFFSDSSPIIVSDNWIYITGYSKATNGMLSTHLYKLKTDCSACIKLVDESPFSFFVEGNWIYYISKNALYKIKTDGSSKTKIKDYNGTKNYLWHINIYGDDLYYILKSDENGPNDGLYKINLRTNKVTLVRSGFYKLINIINGQVNLQ